MMQRKDFIKATAGGVLGLTGLSAFNRFTSELKEDDPMMPVLFIGHGSPMNGIENNEFSDYWKKLATEIPVPKAVLVVSAHWLTKGTRITAMEQPRTIHDFGGFPDELYRVQYPAPGEPQIALETRTLVSSASLELDHDWGLDHGTWTIVRHMYPEANIPILQLSLDITKDPAYHYSLAKELLALRKKGVLILGSGNMVHNLGMVAWNKLNEPGYGYDWAHEANKIFKEKIGNGLHDDLIRYDQLGKEVRMAIPTPEHYLPLLYTLGMKHSKDNLSFFNDKAVGGSLTMTSVRLG
jgi:4,5-DOPA dioxygenase extradiol